MKLTVKSSGDARSILNELSRLQRNIGEIVVDAGETGERLTKAHIATRGTPKSGKRGRIETSRMIDAVTKDAKRSRVKISSRFGWLNDKAPYFKYQEGGFTHQSGVSVPAMYALTDAAHFVFKEVQAKVEEEMRRA